MELRIELVCPKCGELVTLNVVDLAPGRRQKCAVCHTPTRLTQTSLERFRQDLRQFCKG